MELDPNIEKSYESYLERWKTEQFELRQKLITTDKIDDSDDLAQPTNPLDTVHYIGGVDISFPECTNDLVHACAALVIIEYPSLDVVFEKCVLIHLTAPYIPEYLAFREAKFFVNLIEEVKKEKYELMPQVILVDGNGILHPRGLGIASHLGILLDLPTVGVAKKLFHVDGLEKNEEHLKKISLLEKGGDTFSLIGNSGKEHGRALRSTDKASNPVYISVGHKISLDTATSLVYTCCKYRVPESVRQADILSREYLRNNYEKHIESCSEDWETFSELSRKFGELAIESKKATFEQEAAKCDS